MRKAHGELEQNGSKLGVATAAGARRRGRDFGFLLFLSSIDGVAINGIAFYLLGRNPTKHLTPRPRQSKKPPDLRASKTALGEKRDAEGLSTLYRWGATAAGNVN